MEYNILDYSQYVEYSKCPWAWYERYVRGIVPNYGNSQRKDPLCLGGLTHDGLENWYKYKTPVIPAASIEKNSPDRETGLLAQQLLTGYVSAYPMEFWDDETLCTEHQWLEQPLQFPLTPETNGLAKLDAFFYLKDTVQIETGLEDSMLTLEPGYWIREYKTKAAGISRAAFMQSWQTKLQASFQMEALRYYLQGTTRYNIPNGLIISVLEKPVARTPKRKCKSCKDMLDMAAFYGTSNGMYGCPMCGAEQELSPYVPKGEAKRPEYFRFIVTRNDKQLLHDRDIMISVAEMMEAFRCGDEFPWVHAAKERCVDTRNSKNFQCAYFDAHTYGRDAATCSNLVTIADPLAYTKGTEHV